MNRPVASKPLRILAVLTGLLIAAMAVYLCFWVCYVPEDEPFLITLAFFVFGGCVAAFGFVLAWACIQVGVKGE